MTTSTPARYQPLAQLDRSGPSKISQATAIEQSRAIAEVQAAVVVAQNCPRDMAGAESEMEYVCGRLDMAEQAFYQVTNRGTGPSVHLMRELGRIWGNVDYGVKELHRDDDRGESEVQAFAWDIQKNTRSSRTFINPHQRMKQGSRVDLTDLTDIYLSNQNIGARAVRECIATILPRWFTEKAQNICRSTLEHGEGEPIQDRINTMVAWFKDTIGVTEKQMEARLGKKRGQWDAGDVAQMKIAGLSITRGEVQRDELFPPGEAAGVTADEIAAPAEEKPKRTRKTKAQKAREDVESEAVAAAVKADEAENQPDSTGQGGGNDQSQGAEPPSGAESLPDSGDQDSKPGTPMRKALEKRLFALIGEIDPPLDRDDRIVLYRGIFGDNAIGSTDDLNDVQVGRVADFLFQWKKDGEQDDKIRDILNAATLTEENQKEQS